jgi:hypothetical protein
MYRRPARLLLPPSLASIFKIGDAWIVEAAVLTQRDINTMDSIVILFVIINKNYIKCNN